MSGEVRPARLDDAAAIARIHVGAWRVAYRGLLPQAVLDGLDLDARVERWRSFLADPGEKEHLVGLAHGAVKGFLSLGTSRDEDATPTTGEVYAVYVDPDSWRQAIGLRLMKAGLERLTARGFTRATLWILAENQRARSFYEALGMRLDGHDKQAQVHGHPAHELRLSIDLPVKAETP